MQQVVVNGLLTTYEKRGKGQVVLLLHGWGDSLSTYDDLVDNLSHKYQIVRLDLPGFGKSQMPKDVWGLEDYAAFVAAFMAKIGAQNIDTIIGHSNGGAVAMKGLADGKLKASKLVLLASAGIRNTRNLRRTLLKIIAKIGKLLTFWLPSSTKQKLRKKLYGTVGSDMFVAPHLQETFKRTVSQDIQSDASKLKLPTLLIYGSEDAATPPEFGQIFNDVISGSKLEVIEGAAHFVHHDKPSEVNRLITEFLT